MVGADNMVALRTIQPGETVGDLLIVRDGLKPGERVIVDGIQKARPGSKVNPTAAAASVHVRGDGGRRRARARPPRRSPRPRPGGSSPWAKFFIRRPIVAIVIAILTVHARSGHDRADCRSSSIRSWRRRTSA